MSEGLAGLVVDDYVAAEEVSFLLQIILVV